MPLLNSSCSIFISKSNSISFPFSSLIVFPYSSFFRSIVILSRRKIGGLNPALDKAFLTKTSSSLKLKQSSGFSNTYLTD